MNTKVLALIESILKPFIEVEKRDINKMVMYVTPMSPLLEQGYIDTKYGILVLDSNNWLQKGCAYIMEEVSKGSVFGWVIRKERRE